MQTKNRQSRSGQSGYRRQSSSNSFSKYSRFNSNSPKRIIGRKRGGRRMPTFDPSKFINTNPVSIEEEIYTPKNTFDTFGFDKRLVEIITKTGLTIPTPIQDQIIPEIMKGNDVIGLAATGTGKTAAFLIPLIEKTIKTYSRQTLILAPTRELAIQIDNELRNLSKNLGIYSVICVGGISIHPQIKSLRKKNHFIIGTPGRILDLINRKCFDPSKVSTVVLDEADRMLDMGFINDMKTILSKTPKERETLFFSATITNDTKLLVNNFLINPVTVSVKKKDITNSILQDVIQYNHDSKFEKLFNLLSKEEFERVIIFCSMKHGAEKLSKQLSGKGIKSESIHGNKNHRQRQRALDSFKRGNSKTLVATDVAARGIHIDSVSHVINYDLPGTFEDYVHRIGRTGRGSEKGKALTFVERR